jgi:glycosyltransferase involved in cell wall biosynthesis
MRRVHFSASDFRKALRKLGKMFSEHAVPDSHNMRVFQARMVPFNGLSLVRRLNAQVGRRTMREAVRPWQDELPVIVTTVPNVCDYVDSVPHSRIVYYCVDDFSEWPGHDREHILEMENALIARADVFVATSRLLYERLARSGKPTHLLNHGVDLEHFGAPADGVLPLLDDIRSPRIGYFGLFDERSDQELLCRVADAMPEVSFVIAGNVVAPIGELQARPNVHFIGAIPYRELPSLIAGLDALFLAYRINSLTEAMSPLKLKEYLATGLGIVSTPIAAVRPLGNEIVLATTPDEWRSGIEVALAVDVAMRRERMSLELADASWARRAEAFARICESG